MKLSLLEDGVLDYPGRGGGTGHKSTEASPVPLPTVIRSNMPPPELELQSENKLIKHIKECLQCNNEKLCGVGQKLAIDL